MFIIAIELYVLFQLSTPLSKPDVNPCFKSDILNCYNKIYPTSNKNQALSDEDLTSLRVLKKGVTKEAIISYRLEGKITKANIVNYSKTGAQLDFTIQVQGNSNYFSIPTSWLKILDNDDRSELSVADVKKDNNVIYETEWDLIHSIPKKNLIIIL